MELYLVQHGEATPKEVDPARPLTERGQVEVIRVARAAHAAGVTVSTIYHSGKLRAQQTAEIVANELHVAEAPSSHEGLAPNDDPDLVGRTLDSLRRPVMLVGHLPHMSRLCSLLVTGDPEQHPVRFRMGGIVCLVKDGSGIWRVGWMLTPEVIPTT
jgi:phosphohistidine phosphatase